MTVIAWDGKTLAADKQTTDAGLRLKTTKIFKFGNLLVGGCGDTARIVEMREWIENGCKKEDLPAFQRDAATFAPMLVIDNGRCCQYWNGHLPIWIEDGFAAIGSGRDFALAAMYLGKTAREAVEIACHFETGCGNGVDVLEAA